MKYQLPKLHSFSAREASGGCTDGSAVNPIGPGSCRMGSFNPGGGSCAAGDGNFDQCANGGTDGDLCASGNTNATGSCFTGDSFPECNDGGAL